VAKARWRRRFSRQFTYIRRHYHPLGLGEVVRTWRTGEPLPNRALAITVDDGYADFQGAWSLLKAFQIPATLFVVSGFLNRELWLWPDVVHYCLGRSPSMRLSLELPDGTVFERSLASLTERDLADRDLDTLMVAMPDEARRSFVARLPALTGVTLPDDPPGEYAPLQWEELGKMASEGLEVGAHSQTHPNSCQNLFARRIAARGRGLEARH
jgi:peptidoglycan/xylan/chitin deacetylase (PgdA/CDA1 family)